MTATVVDDEASSLLPETSINAAAGGSRTQPDAVEGSSIVAAYNRATNKRSHQYRGSYCNGSTSSLSSCERIPSKIEKDTYGEPNLSSYNQPPKLSHPLDEPLVTSVLRNGLYYAVGAVLAVPFLVVVVLLVVLLVPLKLLCSLILSRSVQLSHHCPPSCSALWPLGATKHSLSVTQCVITVQGTLDIAAIRQLLWRKVVHASNSSSGVLLYPRFSQRVIKRWFGTFWEDDPYFDIQNHVVAVEPHGSAKERRIRSLEDLEVYLNELSVQPFNMKIPLWEASVLSDFGDTNCTLVIFRVHNWLSNSLCLPKLLSTLNDSDLAFIYDPKLEGSFYQRLWSYAQVLILGPLEFVNLCRQPNLEPLWNHMKAVSKFQQPLLSDIHPVPGNSFISTSFNDKPVVIPVKPIYNSSPQVITTVSIKDETDSSKPIIRIEETGSNRAARVQTSQSHVSSFSCSSEIVKPTSFGHDLGTNPPSGAHSPAQRSYSLSTGAPQIAPFVFRNCRTPTNKVSSETNLGVSSGQRLHRLESDPDKLPQTTFKCPSSRQPVHMLTWARVPNVDQLIRAEKLLHASTEELLLSFIAGAYRAHLRSAGVRHPPDITISIPVATKRRAIVHVSPRSSCSYSLLPFKLPVSIEGSIPRLWEVQRRLEDVLDGPLPDGLRFASFILRSTLPHFGPGCVSDWAKSALKAPYHPSRGVVTFLRGSLGPNTMARNSDLSLDNHRIHSILFFHPLPKTMSSGFTFVQLGREILLSLSTDHTVFPSADALLVSFQDQIQKMFRQISGRMLSPVVAQLLAAAKPIMLAASSTAPSMYGEMETSEAFSEHHLSTDGDQQEECRRTSLGVLEEQIERAEELGTPGGQRHSGGSDPQISVVELETLLTTVQNEVAQMRNNPHGSREVYVHRLAEFEARMEALQLLISRKLQEEEWLTDPTISLKPDYDPALQHFLPTSHSVSSSATYQHPPAQPEITPSSSSQVGKVGSDLNLKTSPASHYNLRSPSPRTSVFEAFMRNTRLGGTVMRSDAPRRHSLGCTPAHLSTRITGVGNTKPFLTSTALPSELVHLESNPIPRVSTAGSTISLFQSFRGRRKHSRRRLSSPSIRIKKA